MEIISNNNARPLLSKRELPDDIQLDFDWADDSDLFFPYRGAWYALSDFTRCSEPLRTLGWEGCLGDTYFSGVLIRFIDDGDSVVVGRFYC